MMMIILIVIAYVADEVIRYRKRIQQRQKKEVEK
jgi:hypothetical protein